MLTIKKRLLIALGLSVILLAGCSGIHTSVTKPSADHAVTATSLNNPSEAQEPADRDSPAAHVVVNVNFEKIQGHIKNIDYADGNEIFIKADNLYLFNLDTGRVTAETSQEAFDQHRVQAITDGYVSIGVKFNAGNGSGGLLSTDGGIMYQAIFYDRELNKQSEFHFNTILDEDEMILSSQAIAFSADES